MNIGIIGATGNIGQRIAAEALSRGHQVTGFTRDLRLIVVGGAGSLEIKPGVTRADSPDDLRTSLKQLGLPEAYEVAVRGHRDALNVYRISNRLWTYLSPAEQIYPGERTGRFRLGDDQPVVDADGQSRILSKTLRSR
jgi:uncharacterized protein